MPQGYSIQGGAKNLGEIPRFTFEAAHREMPFVMPSRFREGQRKLRQRCYPCISRPESWNPAFLEYNTSTQLYTERRMFKFRKLTIVVSDNIKSLVSDLLLGLDAIGVSEDVIDGREGEETLVVGYFPKEIQITGVVESLREYIKFLGENFTAVHSGDVEIEEIDRSSWETWRQRLKTVRASRRVIIRPPWEEYSPQEGEMVIEINPSMAFGTGHHETTRLCIRAIEELGESRKIGRALDVGCGSGILSIAALKLGAAEATGVDNDPIAITESEENAARNGVSLGLVCGYLEGIEGEFDLIVMNISAEVSYLLRYEIKSRLGAGGAVIVSGVGFARRDEVVSAYLKASYTLDREMQDGEWMAFVMSVDSSAG
ncbi:MAG: 50S ribosomal protein L11 methyltransferase [Deltaproteobacteria bacterium]